MCRPNMEITIDDKAYIWHGEYRKPKLWEIILNDGFVYKVQRHNMKNDGKSSESWFGIRAILYPVNDDIPETAPHFY